MSDPQTVARFDCLRLALRMIDAQPDNLLLGRAVISTREAAGPGDPLTDHVAALARHWRALRADPAALTQWGDRLLGAVVDASLPRLPFRADLDR